MSRDASLLNEIWGIVGSYIPQKEKVEAAQQLVELFDEHSMTDGFEHETEFYGPLKAAVVAHFKLDEDEDDDNGYDDSDD